MNETLFKELWDKMESLWSQTPPKMKRINGINSFDDFKVKMSSKENRKLFYDYLSADLKKNGIDLGTVDEFESKYGTTSTSTGTGIITQDSGFKCVTGHGNSLKQYKNYPNKKYFAVNQDYWIFSENGEFLYIDKNNIRYPGKWYCDGVSDYKVELDNSMGKYSTKERKWIKESIVKKYLLEYIKQKEL